MKVGIVVVTYSMFPSNLIRSVRASKLAQVSWYIHHHGYENQIIAKLQSFSIGNNVSLYLHCVNRGVSSSWNEGIAESVASGNEITIVANDDIEFIGEGFDLFLNFISQYPQYALAFAHGIEGENSPDAGKIFSQDFACFAIGKFALKVVGFFDENFFPAYYEDTDYIHRIRLSGLPVVVDDRLILKHERNNTIRTSKAIGDRHNFNVDRCRRYFHSKWGSEQGARDFSKPFNNSSFSIAISWERRHEPYGEGFDRDDLLMVRQALFPGLGSAIEFQLRDLYEREILVHLSDQGDILFPLDEWAGDRSGCCVIEGLQIFPPSDIPADQIKIRTVQSDRLFSSWTEATSFVGSRGEGRPLYGVDIKLEESLSKRVKIDIWQKFADGREATRSDATQTLNEKELVPLAAIRVAFEALV